MSDYNIDDAQLEAFDGEQKDVVLNLFKDMHGDITVHVFEKIKDNVFLLAIEGFELCVVDIVIGHFRGFLYLRPTGRCGFRGQRYRRR